jgi:hypothetical protein
MEITRIEKTKSREGKDEVFVAMILQDEALGTVPFGHWLTPTEMEQFILNEDSVPQIMEKYIDEAKRLRQEAIYAEKDIEEEQGELNA